MLLAILGRISDIRLPHCGDRKPTRLPMASRTSFQRSRVRKWRETSVEFLSVAFVVRRLNTGSLREGRNTYVLIRTLDARLKAAMLALRRFPRDYSFREVYQDRALVIFTTDADREGLY